MLTSGIDLGEQFGQVAAARFTPTQTGKNVAQLVGQATTNPNTRTLFQNVNTRQFNFTFKMIPTSRQESEAIEAIEPGPMEGVKATGANPIEVILYGVIPQVMPLWISYSLYRLESNIRSATVVGMVGAGGIGVLLWQSISGFQLQQTAAIMAIVIVTVSVIDFVSQIIRKKFI